MVSQTSETDIQVTFRDKTPVVHLPLRFTVSEAELFKSTCQKLFQSENTITKIIIDFSKTNFIDSCGIGSLVTNLKIAREKNIEFILSDVNSLVMGVFCLTGLDKILIIEQSPHSEVKSKSNSKPEENQLPVTHPSVKSWVKRLIDIVGALVGLFITGILFIPIAIFIKLDSPGPIFFGQIRCGWMGKNFRMWKFRSMCVNAEQLKSKIKNQAQGAIFKNENDPRITKVGSFLRRKSLDELPQFWNVLKGDMSLVGTRPPTPDEVERYEVPQWQRLDVKPGMTGEWQVNGRSQVKNFEDIIRLDLKYQQNWSLIYDIKLIIKTVGILFKKSGGAY
ncbi:MAG: exopolysaccharide biosynthesis polyprenyl glycosylphosphotransferase [Okeania sp. SIO3H1]|uniref:exopolysaccharide biosynthesis polyprenyl glycosylphosphotransferase n=1 Tax=Okeania sp. SIO1I7 TaxID=2607772 RepID=UPI0013C6F9A5|nr:exopolysaccharide biosynthesis polyprenyl glycosylphosphotransferase [Okeania sp. SIO1I7]NEN92147.1 exopolysaccharide biosynthesis polyprenyl glycosylphosphotransferase [Okeania sp. SIO3H1]NET25491.1 exopolysaccharide biosynthesis polyprenyl glycosylphosphotransferase [Okeania sp. SIO1I7]